MANYFLSAFIFRLILPALMSASVVFRPCGLSVIYLLLLFGIPFVPVPKQRTLNGSTGIYLKILIAVSILTTLAQVVFQITLVAMRPYGHFLEDCQLLEKILRHVGFVRLNDISLVSALTWLSPELLMLFTSIICYFVLKKIVFTGTVEGATEEGSVMELHNRQNKHKILSVLVSLGRYLVLIMMCLAAVLRPSVQGGFYFLVFLVASTWWACYKELGKKFAWFLRFMAVVFMVHMSVLYAYQFPWSQELLETNSTFVRYFALTPILSVDCANDPRTFIWSSSEWATYVNPAALYCTFSLVVLLSKGLLKPQIRVKRKPRIRHGDLQPLMRNVSPSKRFSSGRRHLIQDSTGSVTLTNENTEEIPMDQLEEEYNPGIFENVLVALEQIVQVIIKSSYIGTNIIMMAWSITYLSWITFVLLLWANILWLLPQQRKSMLRSSPFLVLYAWFLLISAYIYSMDLTEEELPSTVQGINLAQIGFVKVSHLPCNPLLVKSLFTAMFWITLRQYMYERVTEKQSSALADMVAPLQVTVGTATGVSSDQQQQNTRMMDKIGKQILLFLTKFWIWVVAITLFAVAITGQRMTVFRIVYMALFLLFVLSFQVSFRMWRKMMFAFWLTVIVISMIILVMVYTYQFDNFPDYWEQYLHVPKTQQLDIGLEIFETKQLFVRLVTPTFFVIITVIQLHYFHKDFMELSDPKSTDMLAVDLDESSLQGGGGVVNSERDPTTSTSVKFDLSDVGKISSAHFQMLLELWLKRLHKAMNIAYVFMEIHMPKVVLFAAMLLCVYDKCALYIVIVLLVVLGLTFGRPMMVVAIFSSSIFTSVLLLARMIYQIEYIEPGKWNVTCPATNNQTNGTIENNARWLGFSKSGSNRTLPQLVKWNIIYILVVTLWAVINVRQLNYRLSRGKPLQRAYFMFPNITRNDADKNLLNCLKYLANFMFYKFGVELSLMATVACIGFRMDVMALLYAAWMAVITCSKRKTVSKIWNLYLAFVAVMLPIQYFMTVGLPPTLCLDYPWTHSEILRRVQEWAYLMDTDHPPAVKKLLCDFIVLLFVSRQALVFRIESRNAGKVYAGGSNGSIIHLYEDPSFKNPVPDFITYVHSYLDIFKRAALQGFLWLTLAIVFLAGTNRVNIFSIGYLVGAFIFLWQGSDLYLWPIPRILKSWDALIYYNVTAIFLKVSFQIAGCIFVDALSSDACWLIQIFGIGCVRKFGNLMDDLGFDDPGECKVPRQFIGIVWDGLCFGFLIMQRRIFKSYNFFHMIDETKATTILASRGADLIEELRQNRMSEQKEQEHRVLEKIKIKMDRIKATQQKMQGSVYADSKNHYVDTVFENRPNRRRKPPVTYKQAIRSGDYYMFDDLEDDQVDVEPEPEEVDPNDPANKALKPNLSEIEEHERDDLSIHAKPSTSKDEELSDITEAKQLTLGQKLLGYLYMGWVFLEGSMVTMTNFLNQYSKDYRYVIRVLTKEKKILKEKTKYNVGIRAGSKMIWEPSGSYHSLLKHSRQASELQTSIFDEAEMSSYEQPTVIRLLLAIWYIIMSRSELFCYFIVFLNQIKSATFLSLPLPLMVFFWGSLTVPRPSKVFWVTIIAYTEIIVLLKCVFQFDIIPWNKNVEIISNPFYPPRIIGIERQENYAVWDLLLLLVVFFHRFMLKSMGLWKSVSPVPAVLLTEGDYRLENGELVPVESPPTTKTDQTDVPEIENEGPDEDNIVSLQSNEVEPCDRFPHIMKKATSKYTESVKTFFDQLLHSPTKQSTDVYSYMFVCDFFNFFVMFIGYSSFGAQQGDEGVSSYLEDNRVPALFLVMLILQFMLIIIDRGIFLRKNILAKLIFQFIQVVLLHVWLFVLFPIMTGSRFNSVLPPQMYYMVKCFYLLLSAYQIRSGYPTRILGNFLCKGYSYFNMFMFKGFMLIPFLFELRTVMDWMWTDTSMSVFDWIKMEDIFAHIFQLKCVRHVEDEYPQARGERKNPTVKYLMGGGILALIIGIIWFPLVFFSLGNAVGQPNIPYDVTLEIRIGPYEPVYQMSAQNNSIFQFSEADLQNILSTYSTQKSAVTFISNYEAYDIAAVKLNADSANIWSISPPDRQRMVDEINSTKAITVRMEYKISHKTSKPEDSGVIPDSVEISIPPGTPQQPNEVRENLLKMLNGEKTSPILLEYLMPKFLKVTNRGTAKPIAQLMDPDPVNAANLYRNISLNLLRPADITGSEKEWWQIHEICTDHNGKEYLDKLPYYDCDQIILYTFNDKIFPSTLNLITGGGIIGLYTTLVFVASRLLRGFFAEQCFKIMFEDMPNVDRVLQLCLDVYLVREAREFILEEDLFAKLVFLFRSPETLIKWTRPKEEMEDEEDPEGEDR